eukprot:gene2294-2830_t
MEEAIQKIKAISTEQLSDNDKDYVIGLLNDNDVIKIRHMTSPLPYIKSILARIAWFLKGGKERAIGFNDIINEITKSAPDTNIKMVCVLVALKINQSIRYGGYGSKENSKFFPTVIEFLDNEIGYFFESGSTIKPYNGKEYKIPDHIQLIVLQPKGVEYLFGSIAYDLLLNFVDKNNFGPCLINTENDPRWDYLRSIELLKEKINKFIELTDLGGTNKSYAKELNSEKIKNVYISPERYTLVEKFIKNLNIGLRDVGNLDTKFGIILSGPNGCGKTFENYLLTCIAYVNGAIVIYIPNTQEWASFKSDEEYSSYFLNRFISFNANLAFTIKCQRKNQWNALNLLELANCGYPTNKNSYSIFKYLLLELQCVTQVPVLYSIDEHNEIWKLKKDKEVFFRPFMTSTGSCSGARSCLLISGSSHSQFEHNLQPGLERWLHYINPLTYDSFKIAIKNEGFFIKSSWRKNNNAYRLLYQVTGGTPREIDRLQNCKDQDLISFAKSRNDNHFSGRQIKQYVENHKNDLGQYHNFLRLFFSRKTNNISSSSPGSFVDMGLLYFDDTTKIYHSICYGAFLALFNYYYGNIQRNVTNLTTIYIPSEENFPYWDLVIHQPKSSNRDEKLFFIQISLSDLHSHDDNYQILRSFGYIKEVDYFVQSEHLCKPTTTVEHIIKSITGRNCKTLYEDGSLIVKFENEDDEDEDKDGDESITDNIDFNNNGKFKIIQFTDLHYGEADTKDYLSFTAQSMVLKTEPDIDLVVMTGDSVSGYAWNGQEGWFAEKWLHLTQPMVNANLRWALAMGNHDDEADLNRRQIIDFDNTFNLSLTQQGPEDIYGATNYYLPISDQDGNVQVILYFFDSNDDNCQGVTGWGCVYPNQVQWYRSTSLSLQQKYGRVIPAVAFMHIPIPEYMDMWNFYPVNGSLYDTGVCCFSVNTGLFAAFKEMGDVRSVHCGHDHDNDFIGYYNGIQLGYGRKSGYGGYGPPTGWKHGARVLEISFQPNFSIDTWYRFEDGTSQLENLVVHHPVQTEQYNTCCDTVGFVNVTNTISKCKSYEEEFRNQQTQPQQTSRITLSN